MDSSWANDLQPETGGWDLQLILPSKILNGQFKTSGDLVFHSRTRPHGVDPSETGWEPANFQICRFKKTSEAEHSVRVVDWSQNSDTDGSDLEL
jgi:hypothetical protein